MQKGLLELREASVMTAGQEEGFELSPEGLDEVELRAVGR